MKRSTPPKIHQPLRLLACLVVCTMTLFFLVANSAPFRGGFAIKSYEIQSDCSGQEVSAVVNFATADTCDGDAECTETGSSSSGKLQEFGINNVQLPGTNLRGEDDLTLRGEIDGREIICPMIAYEDLDLYFFDCRAADNGEPICTITMR